MKNLEKITGKTQEENEALYLASLDLMMMVGFDENKARSIARQVFKDTLIRCAEILNNKNAKILLELQMIELAEEDLKRDDIAREVSGL